MYGASLYYLRRSCDTVFPHVKYGAAVVVRYSVPLQKNDFKDRRYVVGTAAQELCRPVHCRDPPERQDRWCTMNIAALTRELTFHWARERER